MEGKEDGGSAKKHALVTGALGGIGKAIVDVLNENGYNVIALDRVSGESKAKYYYQVDLNDFHSNREKVNCVSVERYFDGCDTVWP